MEQRSLVLLSVADEGRDVVVAGQEGVGEDFGTREGKVGDGGCAEGDLFEVGCEEGGGRHFMKFCVVQLRDR